MSHVALYRKYRPLNFNDCIGQEHIRTTLINQITADKVSHAYLFTGSRGTGKTTFARIFAKSVNCQSLTDGITCGQCVPCKAALDPANIDILEIDAASNNGVDDVRDMRERVKYLPVNGRYKVYIIDEVHMLSPAAFNALLKTLEEPPAHVIFILATTEVHKLPATILSRCMRFDFRLVPKPELVELLSRVLTSEKKDAELAAISYIADAAEGSFRDALSILDMCMHTTLAKLTYTAVLTALGAADKDQIAQIFKAIADGNLKETLQLIDVFVSSGKSVGLIAKDIASLARDLLALKAGMQTLVAGTQTGLARLSEIADNVGENLLFYILDEFSKLDSELRFATSPRIVLETTALRAARLKNDSVQALAERVARLEKGTTSMAQASHIPMQSMIGGMPTQTAAVAEEEKIQLPVQKISQAVSVVLAEDAKSIWGRLVTLFRKKGAMQLYAMMGDHKAYRISAKQLIITADDDSFLRFSDPNTIELLTKGLQEIEAPLSIKVEKAVEELDMDKEIVRIQKLTGITPTITKN